MAKKINNKSYVFIDLEMTCEETRPRGYKPEIIEIGLVFMDFNGDILSKEQILVKPKNNKISDFCTNLTGHTYKNLKKNGISLQDACNKMKKLGLQTKAIVAWGDDWNQIIEETKEKGINFQLSSSYINFSLIYSLLNKTYERTSLENALKENDILVSGNLHSGVDDAYNTAVLFQKTFLNK